MNLRARFLLPLLGCLVSCHSADPTPRDLKKRIETISRQVEALRGEKFLHPVQGRFLRRHELLGIYDSVSFEEPDPADSAWERTILALGFIDTMGVLDRAADSVDQASILAFYSRGVLWVVDDPQDTDELDVTIAHELVHALQDQRWDLAKLYRQNKGIDQRLALQYLMEGEARLVETMYAQEVTSSDSLLRLLPALPLEAFRDTLRRSGGLDPEMVTLPTYHPYEQGARALGVRRASGGWVKVDDWFRELPPTTCFLHPDMPCPTVPVLDPSALGVMPRKGWVLLREGRVGEHYMDILFSLWRDSQAWLPVDSVKSAALLKKPWKDPGPDAMVTGWKGDNFQVWRDGAGNLVLLWRTGWRSEPDAQRFFEGYTRLLVRKQRDDSTVTLTSKVGLFRDVETDIWDRVERIGSEVWIAEGVPGKSSPVFSWAPKPGVPGKSAR